MKNKLGKGLSELLGQPTGEPLKKMFQSASIKIVHGMDSLPMAYPAVGRVNVRRCDTPLGYDDPYGVGDEDDVFDFTLVTCRRCRIASKP